MDSRSSRALPKSRSNTRISVLSATASSKHKPSCNTSESTRLVKHHGAAQGINAAGGGGESAIGAGSSSRNTRGQGRGSVAGGGRGRGGGYRTGYQTVAESQKPQAHQKNPVEACLHFGVTGFGWCMISWVIGVVLLAVEYARTWDSPVTQQKSQRNGHSDTQSQRMGLHPRPDGLTLLIFAPFWVGDLIALIALAQVASNVASVRFAAPNRYRGGMRRGDRSTGSLSDLGITGSDANGVGGMCVPVKLDYFPLMQRVVVTAVAAFFVLVLSIVEQVLVCLWWGGAQRGQTGGGSTAGGRVAPGPFSLAAPLLVLEGLCLVKVVLLRTHGLLSGLTWCLVLLLTLSVTLRCDDGSGALREYPWLECLVPLWALDILYFGVACYVAVNTCAGRFVMAPTQGLCFALFVFSLIGSTVAELLLTRDHRLEDFSDKVPRELYVRLDLQLALAVVSLIAFCLAVFLSAEHSVSMMLNTHGYDDPLPLCETPSGWEWSGAGKARWGLLGAVSVRAEKKVALPAGLAGNKETVVSSMDIRTADDAGAYRAYQRTDSGQYVDIYDKL